jgi:hypothetical protein
VAWSGPFQFLESFQIITSESGITAALTAERFGGLDTVGSLTREILSHAPLTGFGLGSVTILDNGYLAFLVHGGLVSLIAYLALVSWLGLKAWRSRGLGIEAYMVMFAVLLMVAAGLGAPAATHPRASTVLWLLICLSLAVLDQQSLPATRRGLDVSSKRARKYSSASRTAAYERYSVRRRTADPTRAVTYRKGNGAELSGNEYWRRLRGGNKRLRLHRTAAPPMPGIRSGRRRARNLRGWLLEPLSLIRSGHSDDQNM